MQICIVFGHLWSTNDAFLRKRLLLLLHQHGAALSTVRAHLDTLLFDIEDGDDPAKVWLFFTWGCWDVALSCYFGVCHSVSVLESYADPQSLVVVVLLLKANESCIQ